MEILGGLELGLLVLESVLLVVTVILLVFTIQEGRARDKLIMEVGRATKMLSRHEYFVTLTDYMLDSEKEVIGCITGRLPTGDDKKRTGVIINNIKKLVRAGVEVRYVLPRFHDRRYLGWLYTQAGAEIRYGGSPLVDDLRYTVVDGKVSIIGIPEHIGEKQATKKGYFIPSKGLSSILKGHFNKCWDSGVPYEQYLEETMDLGQELKTDELDPKS